MFQALISYGVREEAITSILYNRDNNSITISRLGLRGYILKCIKTSYYIYPDEVFMNTQIFELP